MEGRCASAHYNVLVDENNFTCVVIAVHFQQGESAATNGNMSQESFRRKGIRALFWGPGCPLQRDTGYFAPGSPLLRLIHSGCVHFSAEGTLGLVFTCPEQQLS